MMLEATAKLCSRLVCRNRKCIFQVFDRTSQRVPAIALAFCHFQNKSVYRFASPLACLVQGEFTDEQTVKKPTKNPATDSKGIIDSVRLIDVAFQFNIDFF